MNHLTSDELIDAMEGLLTGDRRAHLASCDACRRELADLSSVLSEAKLVGVPEPSPLFWTHFSERVRVAVAAQPAAGGGWPGWLRWQMLAPIGALALVLVALMTAVPTRYRTETSGPDGLAARTPNAPDALDAPDAPDAPGVSDNWVMLADLVGDIDLEMASAAGVIGPGVAEQAVLELTAEEQQELTRLLKAELMRAKS
jgi:hypothetical protein